MTIVRFGLISQFARKFKLNIGHVKKFKTNIVKLMLQLIQPNLYSKRFTLYIYICPNKI